MGGKRVLVVDDEPDFLEMMQLRLELQGYEVLTAEDGRQALERVKKDKPDIVLLDIMMPVMNGLEVLKKIRSINRKLPVYILTAFSNEERFRLAEQFSASGFIVKTKDLKEEIENIATALRMAPKFKGTRKARRSR